MEYPNKVSSNQTSDSESVDQTQEKVPLKKKSLPLKQILVFVTLGLSIFLVLGIFLYLLLADQRQGKLDFYPTASIEKLSFSLPIGEIEFLSWEKNYISVAYDFRDQPFSSKQVVVHEQDNSKTWNLHWERDFGFSQIIELANLPSFKIYLPEKEFNELSFSVSYGKVTVTTLHDWQIEGFLTAGEIFLEDLKGSSGEIEVGWGTLTSLVHVQNKFWNKSTGFEGTLSTGSPSGIVLRTRMGLLR